jgi:hypothetical protein
MDRRDFLTRSLATALATSLPLGRTIAAVAPITGDVEAVSGDGRTVALAKSDLQALRDALRGPLLLPGEPGYDDGPEVVA